MDHHIYSDLKLLDGTINKLKPYKDQFSMYLCGFDTRGTVTEINQQTGEQKRRDILPHETVWAQYEKIDIRTRRRTESFVEVAVVDHGHGIAPDHTTRVFDSFFTTKQDGIGLGLSIARSIIQRHGGAIWAENHASGGAAFRFTLPLKPKP